MTQPFRDSGLVCPGCGQGLRVYGVHGRLVCDHCTSMMLAKDDFAASLRDRFGEEPTIVDGAKTDKKCPRCHEAFVSARVHIEKQDLPTTVYHCATDGVWFAGGDLERVLAEIGKSTRGGFFTGEAATGAPAGSMGLGVGMEGANIAMNAVRTAFTQRDPFVMWYWRKPKPRTPPAPYESKLASTPMACPNCKSTLVLHGNLWGCQHGHGVFVENDALAALVSEILGEPWKVPAPNGKPGQRACPSCSKPLLVERLESVTVDRCAEHGTWFDPTELEDALEHVALTKDHGFRHWLRHLFE